LVFASVRQVDEVLDFSADGQVHMRADGLDEAVAAAASRTRIFKQRTGDLEVNGDGDVTGKTLLTEDGYDVGALPSRWFTGLTSGGGSSAVGGVRAFKVGKWR
jgi:hypothetical protein